MHQQSQMNISEIIHISENACAKRRIHFTSQCDPLNIPCNYVLSLQKLRENIEQVPYQNKQLTLLMGKTKAGKSTLFNLLIGHEMTKVETQTKELVLDISPNSNIQHSEVRHDRNRGTAYPQYHECGDDIFVDCPGLDDNESQYDEIQNSIRILQLQKQNSFRIIVVIDYNQFNSDAGYFSQTFNQIADSLETESQAFRYVGIIFTKVSQEKDIIEKVQLALQQDFLNRNRLRSNAKLLLMEILQTNQISVYKKPGLIRLNPREEEIQLRKFVQSIPNAQNAFTINPIISTNSLQKLQSMFVNYNSIIQLIIPQLLESIKQQIKDSQPFKQIILWIKISKSCQHLTILIEQLKNVIPNAVSFKQLQEINHNFVFFNCFPTIKQFYEQIDLTKFQSSANSMVNNLMEEQSRLQKRLEQEIRQLKIDQENNSVILTQLESEIENEPNLINNIDELLTNSGIGQPQQHEVQVNNIAQQHPIVNQAMQIPQYRERILKYTIIGLICGVGIALIPIGGAVLLLSVSVISVAVPSLVGSALIGSACGLLKAY